MTTQRFWGPSTRTWPTRRGVKNQSTRLHVHTSDSRILEERGCVDKRVPFTSGDRHFQNALTLRLRLLLELATPSNITMLCYLTVTVVPIRAVRNRIEQVIPQSPIIKDTKQVAELIKRSVLLCIERSVHAWGGCRIARTRDPLVEVE
jgi:hypothetical protein